MVFCNIEEYGCDSAEYIVTILILIDGFLQLKTQDFINGINTVVTILILIDGFLQFIDEKCVKKCITVTILILIDGFLQYPTLK